MMVRIKPYVLRQWASNSLVDRACAVNTVAHELTHTVLEDNKQVFTDDKSRWKFWHWGASSPLVSYTVGSYAQCAYLEAHGVIAAGTLATCVEMNGTHTFRGCEHLDDASDGLAQLREPACE